MKLLGVVYIGSVMYQILEAELPDGTLGDWRSEHHAIFVSSSLKGRDKQSALIHEIAHAFLHHYGFVQVLEEQAVEILCDSLGEMITSIFDLRLKKPTAVHLSLNLPDPTEREFRIRPLAEQAELDSPSHTAADNAQSTCVARRKRPKKSGAETST